jgi:hypothetical protein
LNVGMINEEWQKNVERGVLRHLELLFRHLPGELRKPGKEQSG